MKAHENTTFSALDHMILSAGGHTVSELEQATLRSVEAAPLRRVCRVIGRVLACVAEWFTARAEIVRNG